MERYDKYKDSGVEWIGEIPLQWSILPLFVVAVENKKKNISSWCTNLLSLSYGKIINKEIKTTLGLLPESFESYQIVEKGYTILRLTDLQNDKRSLRTGYVKGQGIITSAYIGLIPSRKIEPKFLSELLHAYDVMKIFYGLGNGVRQSMNFQDLKRLPIILPSAKIQNEITDWLQIKVEKLDKIISKKEKLIELLQQYRRSVITEAVTKGLDKTVPMKDSGIEWIGEIPAHWEIKKVKFISQAPLMYGANESAESDDLELPRYIRITDIDDNGKLKSNSVKTLPWDKALPYMLKDGDILFARSGATVGKHICYKQDMGKACFAGYLIKLSVNENLVDTNFINHFFDSKIYWDWVSDNTIQATIQNVSAEKYSNLSIPIPSISEQNLINNYLNKIIMNVDQTTNITRIQIEKLKEYRQSIISEAVTGKIKIAD